MKVLTQILLHSSNNTVYLKYPKRGPEKDKSQSNSLQPLWTSGGGYRKHISVHAPGGL